MRSEPPPTASGLEELDEKLLQAVSAKLSSSSEISMPQRRPYAPFIVSYPIYINDAELSHAAT